MAARADTPAHPPASGIDTRLPWWGVALPALAFAVLLLMIAGPGEAHAATGDPGLAQLVARIQQVLSR
ncbi:hypothetical protein AR457_26865 [Streptomyces agglomeratus]|uniref:hypothetical protein n=1 Tax=Streptomyces agglomeratus TaxID=285458 RepID=UPI000854D541|nr:hypothetical protein [Streptomyces agglomeratus]OEJ38392.1 hypothetical protein BGK70_09790 [Streptomyces agglomeratus]OEJ47223.1 hypothetical protein AR457_26865 [Streptomyces agglomeratus]OEJ50920.1 hypothetical protein BGK72_09275 [Streptomyces agglomeratus]OEJ58290.1 hypothetical protein BGM19_10185 [Streptomyces agglomeratus]